MDLIEDQTHQPVNAPSGNLNARFSVEKTCYLPFRTQLSAQYVSKNQICDHIVAHNQAFFLSLSQSSKAEKSPRLIQGKKQEIERNARLYFYQGNPVVYNSISFHLNLIKGVIYCRNFFDIYWQRGQGCVAYNLISGFKSAAVLKILPDFFHLTEKQSAGISYRIVEFASSDDDIYDGLLDFFFVVVYFRGDLLETGSLKVNASD